MNRRHLLIPIALTVLAALACSLPSFGGPAPVQEQAPLEPRPTPAPPPAPESFPEGPPAPTTLNVPLRIQNPTAYARESEPVTTGLPLPRDLNVSDLASLQLVDASGSPIPAQFTPTARWGAAPADATAPVKWLLVDTQVTLGADETAFFFVQQGGPGPAPPAAMRIEDGPGAMTIDTGQATFSIDKTDGNLSAPGLSGPLFGQATSGGTTYTTGGPASVTLTLDGPMRASVRVEGAYRDASGNALLDYTSRYWFYANQSTVRLFHTVENNTLCPLVTDGQLDCYHIGSGGSVEVDDVSLVAPTDLGGPLSYTTGGAGGDLTGDLTLYQDSSGTDYWDTFSTFADWDGRPLDTRPRMQAYVTFRGYQTTLDQQSVDSGNQSEGWLSVAGPTGAWTVGARDFWQNFPKALRAEPGGRLEVGLFPAEYGGGDYAFSLRAGEHKTHEVFLGPTNWPGGTVAPPLAAAPPEWYVSSGALGPTAAPDWEAWPEYEQYVLYQIEMSPEHDNTSDIMEGPPSGYVFGSLPAAIEGSDFYGIFDYGDWPIDYEGYEVAPLNTKYDSNAGTWLQWARSGDPRWYALADPLNRHLADIDILHNLHSPRHWGDGIAFGHSYHDEDGLSNPHRNEGGNHPDVASGTRGLLLTYYLTGYEKAFESALELADCIEYRVHNDDHLCDVFPDCNYEGFALGPGLYDAGSRPAASSLAILVEAYRATDDQRYLDAADALVGWAVPANQPYMNGPTGEDIAMRPWMLNMYLLALADYIEMKDEFGLPDSADAQGSYLAYADWLRNYAWIDLDPIDSGPRAAYPYEWWFDGRQGDPSDEYSVGNNVPSVNSWLFLGADALAYAYHLSGEPDYLDRAATLFRTGSRDPWYEGDTNAYGESKEAVNASIYGHVFLNVWENR